MKPETSARMTPTAVSSHLKVFRCQLAFNNIGEDGSRPEQIEVSQTLEVLVGKRKLKEHRLPIEESLGRLVHSVLPLKSSAFTLRNPRIRSELSIEC